MVTTVSTAPPVGPDMGTIGYPPAFDTWPPEARLAWYQVSYRREEILPRFREAIGAERPEASDRVTIEDLAEAIDTFGGDDAVVPITENRRTCLRRFRDELGIDRKGDRVTFSEIAIAVDEATGGDYPTAWSCPW